jgi:hypothetical protein
VLRAARATMRHAALSTVSPASCSGSCLSPRRASRCRRSCRRPAFRPWRSTGAAGVFYSSTAGPRWHGRRLGGAPRQRRPGCRAQGLSFARERLHCALRLRSAGPDANCPAGSAELFASGTLTGSGKEVLAARVHQLSGRGEQPFLKLKLRRAERDAARERAVRAREGLFPWGACAQTGPARDRQRRHGLSRRGRRAASEHSGKAAARARRAARAAGRWPEGSRHRRTLRRRHQPRPATRGRPGSVSPRPVLSLGRGHAGGAAVARAHGRIRGHLARPATRCEREDGAAGNAAIDGRRPRTLKRYQWPGNVRELRNVLERALLLTETGEIAREHLPLEKLTTRFAALRAPGPSPSPEGRPPVPLPAPGGRRSG